MNKNNNWDEFYPRPLLRRKSFYSLNGLWLLNKKEIIVPFCKESILSNYIDDHNPSLHYEKHFSLPNNFLKDNERLILNFGAVDQICDVYLNNQFVYHNEGGYLPFRIDITNYINDNDNLLEVKCLDELNYFYPYGKQSKKPKGMWYTPVSGIWQSVFLESVPNNGINDLKIKSDDKYLILDIDSDSPYFDIEIELDNKSFRKRFENKHIEIDLSLYNYQLWSIDNPKLYYFSITTKDETINSYFAFRKIEVKTINNQKKLFLNNKPLFLNGLLDQGYYPDGIFMPGNYHDYEKDIINIKELGFNFLRKHIKVEPETFYYYCDKCGILVMQDMVNSGKYSFFKDTILPTIGLKNRSDKLYDKERYAFFIDYAIKTINHLKSHPCIIAYTIYNEGWGQQNSSDAYKRLKAIDNDRLFDTASGWFRTNASDFSSEHIYFKNRILKPSNRLLILSECGGFQRKIEGHVYKEDGNYGYGKTNSSKELTDKIIKMHEEMTIPSIHNGLIGIIMTQLSDIEEEINGLYTYDREVLKIEKDRIIKINKDLQNIYCKSCEE